MYAITENALLTKKDYAINPDAERKIKWE